MKDGLYYIKIHDYLTIVKIINSKPYLSDRRKKNSKWVETIMEDTRIKKLKPFSEIEMVNTIQGTFKEEKTNGNN